jgi:hypothetical protein
MLPSDAGPDRRRDAGEGGEADPAGPEPVVLTLFAGYHAARAELVRARAELEAKAAEAKEASVASLEAEAALAAHLEQEGEVALGRSVYSTDDAGRLRWKPRPSLPDNWRRYISPSPSLQRRSGT